MSQRQYVPHIELTRAETLPAHRAIEAFTLRAFESETFSAAIDEAVEIAQGVLQVDTVVILRVDYENDQLEMIACAGPKHWDLVSRLTQLPENSWVKHVVRSPHCIRVDDTLEETHFTLLPHLSSEKTRSGLFVAIRGGEEGHIIVAALHAKPCNFTQSHAEFLQTLSHLVGVVQHRRRAADRLRLRDRALESISQGIVITDEQRPQSSIIYANKAFCRMTGFSLSEMIGIPRVAFTSKIKMLSDCLNNWLYIVPKAGRHDTKQKLEEKTKHSSSTASSCRRSRTIGVFSQTTLRCMKMSLTSGSVRFNCKKPRRWKPLVN